MNLSAQVMLTPRSGSIGLLNQRYLQRNVRIFVIGFALFLTCLLTGIRSFALQANSTDSQDSKRVSVMYGKLPLSFEPNLGQTAKAAQWLARGPEYTLFLAGHDAVLQLNAITPAEERGGLQTIKSSALRMNLLGAKDADAESGEEPQQGKANYFTGNDPSKWQKNVPTYGRVRLKSVYAGIDLAYYGHQGQLEYDFVVAPGADASAIRLSFDGAKVKMAANGDLVLPVTGGPEVRFHKPVVYQMKDGARHPVDGSFAIAGNRQVSFKLGAYDKSRELVIDPTLIFLGALASGQGNMQSLPYGMALDAAGEIILTGATNDVTFPVTTGAFQTTCNTFSPLANATITRCPSTQGIDSAFVTKISADGTSLVFSSYLHGISGWEYGDAVAVDSANNEVILGATSSYDFPVTSNAYQKLCQPRYVSATTIAQSCDGYYNGGGTEYTIDGPVLFIAKLDPTGANLLYATFVGGTATITPQSLALDSSNNMYFTGFISAAWPASAITPNTASIQFPTTSGAFQTDGAGEQAATLSVLSADGSTMLYSTLFGAPDTANGGTLGLGYYKPLALAVGPNGMAYIGGQTNSSFLPTTPGAIKPNCVANNTNAYCVTVTGWAGAFDTTKSGAASLVYSTYIGGTEVPAGSVTENQVNGLLADSSNNLFVTGYTSNIDFPTTAGVYQPTCNHNNNGHGCNTSFLSKINPTGTGYIWSTYFGGTSNGGSQTVGNAIALDGKGQVYLYGYNNGYSSDLPTVNQLEAQNGPFAFVATFSPDAKQLLFSTPLFANCCGNAIGNNGIALDSTGNIYVAGYGNDWGKLVTTPGTYATPGAGSGWRSYFAKVSPVLPATATTLAIAPASAGTGQNVTFTATVAGTTQATPVPTGTVTLANQNTTPATTLGTITLGAGGSGTFSTTSLAAGSYSVTASYSGDSNYDVSVSAAQTLTITSLPATTTTLTLAPTGSLTYGQSETLTATVTQAGGGTPTGTATFTEGAVSLGMGTLNASGVATLATSLPVGSGNIVATYGGSSASAGSTSASLMITVAPAPLTVTAANAARMVGVANPTFTGTITGAVNGDTFTATYTTTATLSSPAGTYPIVPSVTGTNIANYSVNLVNGTLTVTQATPTATKLTSSATTALLGTSLTFTATVTGTSGTPAPTGTVTFKDGAKTLGIGTLNGLGVATYSTSSLAVASHSITASYGGDSLNSGSASSAVTVNVTLGATTTALTASAASLAVGSSVTFTATVTGASGVPTPTGTVTFLNGATTLGTGTLNGSGTATYSASALGAGSYSVTASYAGDADNASSISSAVAVTVWPGAPAFTLSLNPANGSLNAGKDAVITVTVTSMNGFNAATTLACSGLPKDATCKFSSPSVTPGVAGTATSTLTIATNVNPSPATLGSETSRSTPARPPFQRPIAIAGALAAFLLFPLFGARSRKARRLLLAISSAILIAVIASIGMSGCAGGPTTPNGTYPIQVTATAGALTQSATYSLTVQ